MALATDGTRVWKSRRPSVPLKRKGPAHHRLVPRRRFRADPYEGTVTHGGLGRVRAAAAVGQREAEVSAASAANSEIADGRRQARHVRHLEFEIDPPTDGMAPLDASDVPTLQSCAPFVVKPSATGSAHLHVSYIATTKRHLGFCRLPDRTTGTFTLTVIDIEDESPACCP